MDSLHILEQNVSKCSKSFTLKEDCEVSRLMAASVDHSRIPATVMNSSHSGFSTLDIRHNATSNGWKEDRFNLLTRSLTTVGVSAELAQVWLKFDFSRSELCNMWVSWDQIYSSSADKPVAARPWSCQKTVFGFHYLRSSFVLCFIAAPETYLRSLQENLLHSLRQQYQQVISLTHYNYEKSVVLRIYGMFRYHQLSLLAYLMKTFKVYLLVSLIDQHCWRTSNTWRQCVCLFLLIFLEGGHFFKEPCEEMEAVCCFNFTV